MEVPYISRSYETKKLRKGKMPYENTQACISNSAHYQAKLTVWGGGRQSTAGRDVRGDSI